MGLIAAVLGAASSTLKDQWKEFFYCDEMTNDDLIIRGHRKTKGNNKGDDNVITNGSGIVVMDGQCMIVVDQGRIVEVCAEPGEYTYDMGSESSVFSGSFGKGLIDSFKTFGRRFSYGGDVAKVQRVYFINTRPVLNKPFGTQNPVPFRLVDNKLGLDLDLTVRCNGTYSYKICDPVKFYTTFAGGIRGDFKHDGDFEAQLRSELLDALQPAFGEIAEQGIRYHQLTTHTKELRDALSNALKKEWEEERGIKLERITLNSVTIPKEDEQMIKEAQRTAINMNPNMAAATLVTAQAEALKTASGNSAGAMTGFMGMGMAQQGAMNAAQLFQMGAQQQAAAPAPAPAAPAAGSWTCTCGTANTGKFCMNCGAQKPAPAAGWTCSCGTVNQGKFCMNCGAKKPDGAPLYRCDKCGWQPEDPKNPPKFCPECGDTFDENDIQK